MAKLLSFPKKLAVLLITLVVSITQFVRPMASEAMSRIHRSRRTRPQVNRALLLRLTKSQATGNRLFQRHFALEATGAFPFVRLVPFASGSPVPVPMLLPTSQQAPVATVDTGLLHAALGGLSGPKRPAGMPPNVCHCSCDSCGGCSSCSSCSSCSCTSCGTSCGGSSCASSCATNSCAVNSCSASCGLGFGNCGVSSCSACLNCASCGSCMSCTSCVCTSCSSCSNCGSCASCAG
jgi:hypothetical protein